MCHGVFDVLHPGHLAHLTEAKSYGDILVVSVTDDAFVNKGPGTPLFPLHKRMEQLAALEVVDYVIGVFQDGSGPTITALKPHLYVRGAEYVRENKPLSSEEVEACAAVEAKTRFTAAEHDSSTRVSAASFSVYPETTERWLQDFGARHSAEEVFSSLDKIAGLSVLVISHNEREIRKYVEPFPLIPENYSIGTKVVQKIEVQGAGNVVLQHVKGFVAKAQMLTQKVPVIEENFVDANNMRDLLSAQDRTPDFWLRGEETDFTETLRKAIPDKDVVIVVDYGHGLVTPSIQATLESQSRFLAATVKAYPTKLGFNNASKYNRMDYFCLTELEYNLAASHSPHPFAPEKVMISKGKRGSDYLGYSAPSFAVRVADTVGCGDAILALTAPLVAIDTDPEIVNFVGQAAAAIQCEILFTTRSIKPAVLRKFIARLLA